MGKQYFHSTTDEYDIALAFEKVVNQQYQFHVEIENKGMETFLVAPESFFITSSRRIKSHVFEKKVFALDPEQQILETQKDISRAEASYSSASNTQTLLSFIDLVVDISQTGTQTEAEELEEENEDLQREIDELQLELDYAYEMNYLDNYMSEWEYNSLRKTSLPSGFVMSGRIFFPVIKKADSLNVHLTLAGQDNIFRYNQKIQEVK
jgi:cell division protein FtsB